MIALNNLGNYMFTCFTPSASIPIFAITYIYIHTFAAIQAIWSTNWSLTSTTGVSSFTMTCAIFANPAMLTNTIRRISKHIVPNTVQA